MSFINGDFIGHNSVQVKHVSRGTGISSNMTPTSEKGEIHIFVSTANSTHL